MLLGTRSPSPTAQLCPAWDPNSSEIPSVLVNEPRLLLCLSILANSADRFGFIFTRCTPQPPAEMGCLHPLAFQLTGLPACLHLCFPATSLLHSTLLAAQTVQQHRQTGSHPLTPAPTFLSCFSPLSFPVLNCEIPLMGRNRLVRPSR